MKIDFDEAFSRLLDHAGLPSAEQRRIALEDSFSFKLWKCDTELSEFNMAEMVNDIINCLEVVNKRVNGEVPSENAAPRGPLDRHLVWSMTAILHDGWELYWKAESRNLYSRNFRDELARGLWAISLAWMCVVGGDIDSLREGVFLDGSARGLGPFDFLGCKVDP